ncbi:WxL domain-containing protein [Vagococcus sp. BWB3-3]|uniref:WxL domain-containing protein n=1 Tax=Vagococcus allomyrinae TaxID=2794353 RepID=A0A940SU13_9ENTE|nr:WxL domain-containing protein [Vagococcus allomyrinae]MBP1040259.1 WxL domain-containing protein [Vagococcus allomyrinae]
MKKLVTGMLLATVILGAAGFEASAATVETKGDVIFKTQGDDSTGEVTKPETDDEIIKPVDPNNSKGTLRVNHISDYHFGEIEVKSDSYTVDALMDRYVDKDDATETEKDISHYIQVEDVRGEQKGWTLSVKANPFTPQGGGKALEQTYIELTQAKLSNTRMSGTEIVGAVNVFDGAASKNLTLGQSVEIMSTKAGKNTDSSKTSLVFNTAYTEADPAAGASTRVGEDGKYNPGVKLHAIGTDEKLVGKTYVSTLEWTLADGI